MSDETERLAKIVETACESFAMPIPSLESELMVAAECMRALQAKVDRLTSRGFHDLHWENDELKARVKELEKAIENAPHTEDCDRWHAHKCKCWKSEALND